MKWLQVKYTGKDINPRLQRWLAQLGEYNIRVNYINGELNKVADFLSRINSDTNEINYLAKNGSSEINENEEEYSLLVQTVHSQEEDLNDHIPFLDTIVNRFKYQKILTETEMKTIFNKKQLFIDLQDIETTIVIKIVRKHIGKGKVAIFSELNDNQFNKLQQILVETYSGIDVFAAFVKCSYFAKDIKNENELNKQISLFQKN